MHSTHIPLDFSTFGSGNCTPTNWFCGSIFMHSHCSWKMHGFSPAFLHSRMKLSSYALVTIGIAVAPLTGRFWSILKTLIFDRSQSRSSCICGSAAPCMCLSIVLRMMDMSTDSGGLSSALLSICETRFRFSLDQFCGSII